MGQQDISDLRCDEIDGRDGFVERERSKTGVKAKHKLWQITLDLLAEHKHPKAAGTDRVFLTAGGHPLVRREIIDGTYKMSDAVKSSFYRVQMKTGINDGRGFYCLRRTGATLIETIDPAVTEMYLSHVEPGMKRAYAQRDWGRLERALIEMEGRLPLRL